MRLLFEQILFRDEVLQAIARPDAPDPALSNHMAGCTERSLSFNL